MYISLELTNIVGSELEPETNNLSISLRGPSLTGELDSSFLTGENFGALGVTSRPYDADENGSAQAITCPELQGAVIGIRDPRVGSLYGELDPGDTCIHCTSPEQSARMLFKGKERQAAVVVDKKNGKQLGLSIGGAEESVALFGNGATLTMNRDGSFALLTKWGSGIVADASGVWVKGSSVKLGGNPTLPMNALQTAPIPFVGLAAGSPGVTLPGVMTSFPSSIILTP